MCYAQCIKIIHVSDVGFLRIGDLCTIRDPLCCYLFWREEKTLSLSDRENLFFYFSIPQAFGLQKSIGGGGSSSSSSSS